MSATPPRLARWALTRRMSAEEREFAAGDLEEEFAARAARDRRAAKRWYWRQLRLSFTTPPQQGSTPPRRTRDGVAISSLLAGSWQDVRYAARSLAASPTLAVVAILTLALGIGLTTAIYAVVDGVLLRPLPFADADRLVVLRHNFVDGRPGEWNSSFPLYLDFQKLDGAFDELAAWQENDPTLTADAGGTALRIHATGITANLPVMLGIEPALGRNFLPEEDAVDAPQPVAMIAYPLWRDRFGADPEILGKQLRLDDVRHTIIGVMPRSFTGAMGGNVLPVEPTDVWLPYRNSAAVGGMHLRGLRNVTVVGKLAAGVTLEQARQDAAALAVGLAEQYPDAHGGEGAALHYAHDAVVEGVRPTLWVLLGAVSLVLLIACTNVANLLLGRTAARRREVAVRMALGAGRARLIRQMLAESVLLGALGGVLACGIAALLVNANQSLVGRSIPRLEAISIDAHMLWFAAAVSLGAGLLLGVIPAVYGTRGGLQASLKSSDRGGTSGRESNLLRQSLVVAEIAMSVVLLIGAGLLIRSFDRALQVDPGFDASNVLTARVRLPIEFVDTENWALSVTFFEEAIDRLEGLPGVTAVSAAFQLPTEGGWSNAFTFPDRPPPAEGHSPYAIFRPVSPGFFELADIALLRGRRFTAADHADAPRVVIVNQAFVDEFFPDGDDPVGKQITSGNWWAGGPPEYEIVGVVENVRFSGRTEDAYRATYFPHAQQPVREMSLMLKTSVPPMQLAAAMRAEIGAIDAELPVDDVATLDELLAEDETVRQTLAVMGSLFALSAMLLAAIGIYGVTSFAVAQRTRELGIRMALGARSMDVRTMILRRGAALVAIGLIAGLVGATAASRAMRGMLFGVDPADPLTLVAVVAFLGAVGLLACWLPARRATRVDPMVSLRAD